MDAIVSLVNADTGLQKQVKTNSNGLFLFTLLPPGRYTAKAQREGFATTEVQGLVLRVNDQQTITLPLKVGSVNETVDVIDKPATSESTSVSMVIDRQFAEELPLNGRSFDSLLRLTPGTAITVAQSWEPGQYSFNGQRPNANYYTVDGVGANIGISPTNYLEQTGAGTSIPVSVLGGANSLVSVDALQEFRIETSSYAPEFGRTPGAQVSMLTRSGTNSFHGTLFDYLRNDAFDANDWFANSLGLAKPPLRQNDFGGVLGGPIVRNRTFFFGSYEGLRLRLPFVGQTFVPSTSLRTSAPAAIQPLLNAFPVPNGPDLGGGVAGFPASFSNPSTVDVASIRIDHTVNKWLSLFGRFHDSPTDVSSRGGFGVASMITRGSNRTTTATLGATGTLGPRVSNDVRVNYSHVRVGASWVIDNFGGATPLSPAALFPSIVDPANAAFSFAFPTLGIGFNLGPVSENFQRQLNIVDGLSTAIGSHALKFGIDYRRLSPITSVPAYQLEPVFFSLSDILSGQATQVYVTANRGRLYPRFMNFSAYAQDSWRMGRRATLTYGLRWEVNPPPSEGNGNMPYTVLGLANPATMTLAPEGTPSFKTTYGNFAPRAGIRYEVFGTAGHETILRGGFGTYYDLGTGTASSAFFAGGFPNSSTKTVYNAQFPLTTDVLTPLPFSTNPPYPELVITDPHLSLPRTYEWSAAVEQSLGRDQLLTISYVGAAGRQLLRREYINPTSNFAGGIEVTRNLAISDYHALQIQFRRRLSHGLQASGSYTWGHSTDNDSFESESFRPVATLAPNQDHGPSSFDVRHQLSAAVTYDLRNPFADRRLRPFFRGWAIDGTLRVNSAPPVNVYSLLSVNGMTRPNVVAGIPFYIDDRTAPGGWRINSAAFAFPAPGQQGNLGRNALRGFPLSQTDMAIVRAFRVTERVKLQFRVESFNVFNHPNFAQPVSRLRNPAQFGRSTSMLNQSLGFDAGQNPLYQIGGPRSIQLSARLHF
jgi:hypothetical protein